MITYSHLFKKTFGLLTAVEHVGPKDRLLFVCVCGNPKVARFSHVKAGTVKSCGCLLKFAPKATHQTHGLSKTPEYAAWDNMLARCSNPQHRAYKNYGGRGISVCAEWAGRPDGLLRFISDMGSRPKGMSLDRRNNELGYCKENCYWATRQKQAINRRSTIFITIDGVTQPANAWCAKYGINETTAYERIKRGWSACDAVVTPTGGSRKH